MRRGGGAGLVEEWAVGGDGRALRVAVLRAVDDSFGERQVAPR